MYFNTHPKPNIVKIKNTLHLWIPNWTKYQTIWQYYIENVIDWMFYRCLIALKKTSIDVSGLIRLFLGNNSFSHKVILSYPINSCHTRERCRFGRGCIYAHSQQELNEWKQEYDRKLKEKAKEDIKKREELFSSEMASKFLKAPPEDVSLLFHVGVTDKIRQTDAKFYFFSYHNDNSDIEHLLVRRNDKKSNLNFEKIPHKWKANFTPKCTRGKIELKLIQLKILCFWNTHPIIVV